MRWIKAVALHIAFSRRHSKPRKVVIRQNAVRAKHQKRKVNMSPAESIKLTFEGYGDRDAYLDDFWPNRRALEERGLFASSREQECPVGPAQQYRYLRVQGLTVTLCKGA
jgi:hypothetical protein